MYDGCNIQLENGIHIHLLHADLLNLNSNMAAMTAILKFCYYIDTVSVRSHIFILYPSLF